ncbi:hypothetical protein Tco_0313725 [Tanacetum coccineum]
MYKMKEDYGIDEVTLYPSQIFSVNNWALKPNQPEEPPFTAYMLAICALERPVVFKAPKNSSKAEGVSQGAKPGAKTGHKKPITSSKQPSVSSKETTKGGSSKAPTGSKTGHSKKRKETSSAMVSNPSAFSIDPHVLADQTKSVSEGLEIFLTQPTTEKGASSTAIYGDKEEASSTIKLEDLSKLVSQIKPSFKDLDSPEDDVVIIINESDKDKLNAETEDTSVPRSSSPRSSKIKELTNQVLILQSKKHKLELEKNKAEAEVILSSHDFSSSLPTKLKDLPSKFNELTEEIKGLKKHFNELENMSNQRIEKQISKKLEDFTKLLPVLHLMLLN